MQDKRLEQVNERGKLRKIRISLQENIEFIEKFFLDLCEYKYGDKSELLQGQLDVCKYIISQIDKWVISANPINLFYFRNWCYDEIYECIDELCRQKDLKHYLKGKIIAYIYTIELISINNKQKG